MSWKKVQFESSVDFWHTGPAVPTTFAVNDLIVLKIEVKVINPLYRPLNRTISPDALPHCEHLLR